MFGMLMDMTTLAIPKEAFIYKLVSIDLPSLVQVSVFMPIFLFSILAVFWIVLLILKEMRIISKSKFEKIVIFSQKLAIAAYPTLVLACALDENSFSLLTNLISFFAIFTFVFKTDFFEK
jgi:hypothetical protein